MGSFLKFTLLILAVVTVWSFFNYANAAGLFDSSEESSNTHKKKDVIEQNYITAAQSLFSNEKNKLTKAYEKIDGHQKMLTGYAELTQANMLKLK